MDTLSGLLDGPRARGAFLLRSVLDPPFALRIADEAPLSLVTVVRGAAWVVPADGRPVPLGRGDVALLRGPGHYTVCDDPGTPVGIIIGPGQRCVTVDGRDLTDTVDAGVRTWGHPGGATVLLSGTYRMGRDVSRRLLGALPTLLVRPAGQVDGALVRLLAAETARDEAGQELILDRLLDLLLITLLRSWFATAGPDAPPWYRARHDAVVAHALRLLHDDPAHGWTVAGLAARTGVSRAALARRFTALVGEPPMTYLTTWRLTLAADLLRDPQYTVGAVARQVGYGGSFALSSAFKRMWGISPRDHRAAGTGPSTEVTVS